jgi:ketosteroid isomerase-like protein
MTLQDELQAFFDAQAERYRAGDWRACAAMYSDQASIFSPYSPPARGRAEIDDLFRRWTTNSDGAKRLLVTACARDGNLAWCLLNNPDGGATSLNVLERQADGAWKVTACSINANDYDEDA